MCPAHTVTCGVSSGHSGGRLWTHFLQDLLDHVMDYCWILVHSEGRAERGRERQTDRQTETNRQRDRQRQTERLRETEGGEADRR